MFPFRLAHKRVWMQFG